MKLPREIQSGVQSLGQEDPSTVISASRSRQAALGQAVDVVVHLEKVDEASRVSKESSGYLLGMEKMKQQLLGNQRIQIEEIPEGVDFEDDGSGSVNASEIMDQMFDLYDKEMSADATSRIRTEAGKTEFNNTVLRARAAAAGQIAKQSIAWGNNEKLARFDQGFEDAQEYPDREQAQLLAMKIANEAYESGVWSDPEYLERVEDMLQRTDADHYVREMNATEDTDVLAMLGKQLLNEKNNLSTDQKIRLASAMTTRGTRIDAENLAADKLRRTEQSKAKAMAVSDRILRGGALESTAFDEATEGLEISEYNNLRALNRSLEKEEQTNVDEGNMAKGMIMVHKLSLDPNVNSRSQAMAAIAKMLEPNEDTGRPEITGAQAITLWGQVDEMQDLTISSTVYKEVQEDMYRLITNGSSVQFGRNNSGAEAITMSRALGDLREAARAEGPAFDAEDWWSTNQGAYLGKTYRDNLKTVVERGHNQYLVMSGTVIQLEASINKVRESSLPPSEIRTLIDKITNMSETEALKNK